MGLLSVAIWLPIIAGAVLLALMLALARMGGETPPVDSLSPTD